jgi:hypothetical protein
MRNSLALPTGSAVDGLPNCPLVFANSRLLFFILSYKMFVRRSVHNDTQSFLETQGMTPKFAGVEKFFTQMTFKTSGAAGLFLSEAILPARNPKRKSPGAGRRVNGGSRGHTEERP